MAEHRVDLLASVHGYRRAWVSGDLIAGLTVWAVLVPESLAYATIAGVSPVIGLYAVPPALLFYALFGSSKVLITGPSAATAALSAAAVAQITTGGPANFAAFTAMLAIVTGVLALLAGLFRMGFLANFISEPVMKGFIIGLALTILVGQLPKLFGIEKSEGDFFKQLWKFLGNLGDTQWLTLLIGSASLAIVLVLRRFAPKVPGSLIAVFFGIIAVKVFNLDEHGVAIVGHINSGFPSIGLPHSLSLSDYFTASASAVGILLVGFAEGLGAAKTYATRGHYEIDPNRELIGLGAANIGAGLCSGMVVGGSLSKTALSASSGARTQVSGIFVAVMTVFTFLFLTGLFEDLPEATLAAVVIGSLIALIDFAALTRLYRLTTSQLGQIYGPAARPDFIAAIAAMFGVLIFDTLPGLFIGIGVSLLLLLYRSSRPHIAELGKVPGTPNQYGDRTVHAEDVRVPGVLIARIEGGLYFANADTVRDELRNDAAKASARAVVLDAEAIPFIDVTAASMLDQLARDLDANGVHLVVARDIGQVRDLFKAAKADALLDHLYPSVQSAVDAVSKAPS